MTKAHSKKRKKLGRRVPETSQLGLFSAPLAEVPSPVLVGRVEFHNPSPERIFLGSESLRNYLKHNGMSWVIELRAHLEAQDWSSLAQGYVPEGRKPIHPQVLLGLVLYGILEGHSTLRSLEQIAKCDVRAWWICGGLHPDHSTIGNFLQRHRELLSADFFLRLTKQLVRQLHLRPGEAAGDGTVIEAVASRYRKLAQEAADEAVRVAQERAERHPGEPTTQAVAVAQVAAQTVRERTTKATGSGGKPGAVHVNPTEPEAVYQPRKDGARRFCYKPSVIATPEGLIAGQDVQGSDENASVEPLLDQYETVFEAPPVRTMWDAGYHTLSTLTTFVEREVDALVPSGQADRGTWEKKNRQKFAKTAFRYDPTADGYVCPAGKLLNHKRRTKSPDGQPDIEYSGAPCANCDLRSRCTSAAKGRTIKRYEGDEFKEAMGQIMSHPQARSAYRQRKAIVEPVFAEMRERYGLTRFRHRGLAGVRLEFSLYCMAHNLKRTISLGSARKGAAPSPSKHSLSFLLVCRVVVVRWRHFTDREEESRILKINGSQDLIAA